MRVLFVPDTASQYGATNSLKELVCTLEKNKGIEPIIVMNEKNPVFNFFKNKGYEVHNSIHKAFMINNGRTKIKKIIKICMIPYFYIVYKISNYISVRNLEKEIDFSKVDLIHTNVNRNDLGAILAKRHNIKHIWHIREFGKEDYNCFSLRYKYINFMNKYTSRFIAISNAVANSWIDKGLDKNKINVIYNGVDTEKFEKINKERNSKIKILISGYITTSKGQLQLIKSLKYIPKEIINKLNVDIYGTGNKEYINLIKEEIENLKLEKVVSFKGYRENMYEIMPQYDIGVVCSKAEGFGRVTVEYMMSGLCVIVSNTGANTELIQNENTGLIYEYNNEKDLASKIEKIINDKKLYERISKNGYTFAKDNFTNIINANKVYDIYKKVLNTVVEKDG